MPLDNLIRLGGLAAILAGVLAVLAEILGSTVDFDSFSQAASSGTFFLQALLFLISAALLQVGLVGLYAHQSEAASILGVVGFLVALIGSGMVMGIAWEETFVPPALAQYPPDLVDPAVLNAGPPGWVNFGFVLSSVLFALGWVLFGVASLRARVYPRIATILLIVGAVVGAFPLPFTTVVFAVAVIWMSFALLTGRGAAAGRPQRVS